MLSVDTGIYFSVCLALMVISLLETVFITNVLHHNSMKHREVPPWMRVVVLKHLANLICYRGQEETPTASAAHRDDPEINQSHAQTPAQRPTSNGGNVMSSMTDMNAVIFT